MTDPANPVSASVRALTRDLSADLARYGAERPGLPEAVRAQRDREVKARLQLLDDMAGLLARSVSAVIAEASRLGIPLYHDS